MLDEARQKNDANLGSEPYKKTKTATEITTPKTLIKLENTLLEGAKMKNSSSFPLLTVPVQQTGYQENPISREKNRVEPKFKSEKNTINNGSGFKMSSTKIHQKPNDSFSKTHAQQFAQQSRLQVQTLPSEMKPDRVYNALMRSTPHIKLSGSLYDNQVLLVLPSSLFGK